MKRFILVAAAALAVATASAPAFASTSHGLTKVHDPGHVTGTIHGHCSYLDHGKLPDPRCTPGSIDPAVTQGDIWSTICKRGWTATVRPPEPQTQRFKYGVAYPHYGVPSSERTELDHLVPLELGGSNDATNLWPETPPTPNTKDKVENALNHAVCDGRVKLAAAQLAIASNWLTAEQKLGIGGGSGGGGGGGSGAWCSASASYNATYGDYDIYVYSNQPDKWATATASNGASHGYWTDGSGYVAIFLRAASGDTVRVTVGAASCSTTA